jgi:aryl-alcohol dehydrogenase
MSFAVFGSGAVGLSALMAARVAGAQTIVAIDRVASRLDLARSLGATHIIDADREDVAAIIAAIAPDGIDRAIDTTGRIAVMKDAVQLLAQRGVLAVASHTEPGGLATTSRELILGSKSIRGVAEGGRSAAYNVARILHHFVCGEFPFDKLIKYYPWDQIGTALRDARSGEVVKPVLQWDRSA